MLLKEEACEGARMRGPAGPGRRRDPTPHPTATYAVRLPQALLPPPPLVLPDEPGGGALLRGAAQPGAQSGREGGCRGVRPAERAPPFTQLRRGAWTRPSCWLCTPHPAPVAQAPHDRDGDPQANTETQTQGTLARPPALAHSVCTTSTRAPAPARAPAHTPKRTHAHTPTLSPAPMPTISSRAHAHSWHAPAHYKHPLRSPTPAHPRPHRTHIPARAAILV